jgi:hypothetical protein
MAISERAAVVEGSIARLTVFFLGPYDFAVLSLVKAGWWHRYSA